MKSLRVWRVLLLSLVVSGCALFTSAEQSRKPTAPYAAAGELSDLYFHSPSGDLVGKIPAGWLRVDLSTVQMPHVLCVFTDKKRANALVLSELPATAEFRRTVERDGISALTSASFSIKSAHHAGLHIVRPATIYTSNDKLIASYEYSNGADTAHARLNRVATFTTGARFYELEMAELADSATETERVSNFRLLEAVIGSLQGVAQVNLGNRAAINSGSTQASDPE